MSRIFAIHTNFCPPYCSIVSHKKAMIFIQKILIRFLNLYICQFFTVKSLLKLSECLPISKLRSDCSKTHSFYILNLVARNSLYPNTLYCDTQVDDLVWACRRVPQVVDGRSFYCFLCLEVVYLVHGAPGTLQSPRGPFVSGYPLPLSLPRGGL